MCVGVGACPGTSAFLPPSPFTLVCPRSVLLLPLLLPSPPPPSASPPYPHLTRTPEHTRTRPGPKFSSALLLSSVNALRFVFSFCPHARCTFTDRLLLVCVCVRGFACASTSPNLFSRPHPFVSLLLFFSGISFPTTSDVLLPSPLSRPTFARLVRILSTSRLPPFPPLLPQPNCILVCD